MRAIVNKGRGENLRLDCPDRVVACVMACRNAFEKMMYRSCTT